MPANDRVWKIWWGIAGNQLPSIAYLPKNFAFKGIWTWDNEATAGTIWSTGSSGTHLRSTLYVSHPAAQEANRSQTIYWLNAYTSGQNVSYFYAACKVTEGQIKGNDNHNFIKHEATLKFEFSPADPNIKTCEITVKFYDYLNFFYQYIEKSNTSPFIRITPLDLNFDYGGEWLLWHSTRLEEEMSWDPPFPSTPTNTENYNKVAVTVLSGMPSWGGDETSVAHKGNLDKGRGMASEVGGTHDHRVPLSVPMFMGPGYFRLLNISGEKIAVGGVNEKFETEVKVHVHDTGDIPIKTVDKTSKDKNNPTYIHVQSILANYPDAHTLRYIDKWNETTALISERPRADGAYYRGNCDPLSDAPYVINEIKLSKEWLSYAKKFKTKYAIVFLMIRGKQIITATDFVNRYSQNIIDETRIPKVIYDMDRVKPRGNDAEPVFTIKEGDKYKYIIDPTKTTTSFKEEDIKVQMPEAGYYYQFAALIYQITPIKNSTDYQVDPDRPYPIEYWCGVSTKTLEGDGFRRLEPPQMKTKEAMTDDKKKTDNTDTQKSVNLDEIVTETQSGSEDINLQPVTDVTVRLSVPPMASDKDLPPAGSYIRFFLLELDTLKKIWNDTMTYLPITAGEAFSREILFVVGDQPNGHKYRMYRQLYDRNHLKIGGPRAIGPTLTANKTHIIQSLDIEVTRDTDHHPTFSLKNLNMPNAPRTEQYYYKFEFWYGNNNIATVTNADPSQWDQFKWVITLTGDDKILPDSVECDLILSVYADMEYKTFLSSYYRLYLTPHYITSFSAENVFTGSQDSDAEKNGMVRLKFTATTLLESADDRYKCKICLYPYTDTDTQPDSEPNPMPTPLKHWDYPSINDTFEATTEPFDIDLGTYRLSLQLIENKTGKEREIFYTSYETSRPPVSGWIATTDDKIQLKTPFELPNEEEIEYRMLKDGVLGEVASSWEMRTESVIGGNAVTQPAWIVRPRTVSFRVLVTAPSGRMSEALQKLINVLTFAPTEGVELQLQTTDSKYQLKISGYIQIGSPKIEIREDTMSIVSVTLDCPDYAWKGHSQYIPVPADKKTEYTFTPKGHLPPTVDVWVCVENAGGLTLTVNDHRSLSLKPHSEGNYFIHIHHDPITQKYSLTEENSVPASRTPNGVRLRHSPLSARSILLGNDNKRKIETQSMFDLVKPESYLPIILDPSKVNTIKVNGGSLFAIEYTPRYAFWW